MKKVYVSNTLVISVIAMLAVGFWSFWIYMAVFSNLEKAIPYKEDKKEVTLNIEIVESGGVIDQNDDVITLLAPVKYKVTRTAYGDDCWYNLSNSAVYGFGEDTIMMNTADENTYRIVCQPLMGNGEVAALSKTVIVVSPAELSSAGSVSLSK